MGSYIKLIKNNWLPLGECGWGNGYVVLPKEHKYHGVDYMNIPVYVHGGLTYSGVEPNGMWAVGFDTAHPGDDPVLWDILAVEAETLKLLNQLEQ